MSTQIPDYQLMGDMAMALFQGSPDGIVVVDDQGRIRLVNPAAELIFGYTSAELVGRSVEMLVPEELRELHERHRAEYMLNPRNRLMAVGLDLEAVRKSGERMPVDINLAPVVVPRGIFVVATVRRGGRPATAHGG